MRECLCQLCSLSNESRVACELLVLPLKKRLQGGMAADGTSKQFHLPAVQELNGCIWKALSKGFSKELGISLCLNIGQALFLGFQHSNLVHLCRGRGTRFPATVIAQKLVQKVCSCYIQTAYKCLSFCVYENMLQEKFGLQNKALAILGSSRKCVPHSALCKWFWSNAQLSNHCVALRI